MSYKKALLTGVAAFALAGTATAQTADETQVAVGAQPDSPDFPTPDEPLAEYGEEDSDTIVVTGARQRGSVIGDIPPENVLTTRDVIATGATDIDELLEAIAPQLGSARGRGGGRPIMLLNGQRVSSFRELRDIPTEAISRVEVLPEEVALKYGYRADQRVVNIVLRPRFRSTVAEIEGTTATQGGYGAGEIDLTRLMIGEGSRTTLDFEVEGNSALTESERDIGLRSDDLADDRAARSLLGNRQCRCGA
ncbi:MAG: TonB-dependent receptor plug domain-containing protein [Pseudomonadota bacterium]|nr:TonB-dependent receptor plug domain-containing protein [Pseudomonadota bacterium]